MMSRSVFRASRWNAIVSMSSNRTTWYEYGNDENRRGWHTGAGVLTWWDSAGVLGGQISDAYWPTADPYGHAGATLSRRPLADGAGGAWRNRRPTTAWAGGAAVMAAAAIGAPVRVMGSTLRGAKSWFFSGDVIVCLGSGITSNDGYGVETAIDYRNLGARGGNTVLIDGVAAATSAGSPATASGASWVHVDGHAGYAMIGAAQPVVVLRDDRAGSWSLMSVNGPKTTITRQYVRVFVDHGIDPQAAMYSYVMLPGASPRETRDYAAAIEGTIQVLSQTDDVHAVRFTETDLRAINFWRAVPIAVADVRVTVPVSILLQPDGAASWIAVSDPQVTASTVDVTVSMAGTYTASDPRVSLVSDGASVTVRVDLSGLQGQTVTVPLDLL